jgi:biotin operon repressor
MKQYSNQSLLFEMLRSFVTLADTLNVSRAVQVLGVTRQTLRRHIEILEDSRGQQLFMVEDRQYRLTEEGSQAVQEARSLLERGRAWLESEAGHREGLFQFTLSREDGYFYHLQQHPISRVWTHEGPVMREAIKAWAQSEGQIEHPAFQDVRPHALVFRFLDDHWLCAEVGEASDFARWYGWSWARSSVGRKIDGLPGAGRFNFSAAQSYDELRATQGLRLDHVATLMPHGPDDVLRPICFARLLLGCSFPDGSFAMMSMVDRNCEIDIPGLEPAVIAEARAVECAPRDEMVGRYA